MANIIGLTGQTGAGKSTVREIFYKKGAAVIDADSVAHGITDSNLDCIYDIVCRFSCLVLDEKGKINRKALGKRVFSDKKELEALNRIIFPYILDEIEHLVLSHIAAGVENIIIDGATVIESGCGKMCDVLVSVVADPETRMTRIIKRDGITKADAERRIRAQKPEEFYTERSDFVIRNDSTEADLERNVNSVLKNMVLLKEKVSAED
ncbi:MAG: dephospho-CoA kinase [Oscillospiraceae bacterium]|nr:dephospho-CoA kinase [Oscillospiraceae bacterium]MBQ3500966.1 dephospho-CoA kinase [Oscillospiraceae bacterium]MBQ4546597.1 dephospho-CoA kinase [Oscillospiraceae bacterium]MBQ4643635.1 dephospho-CoA kinase [Oscillospiraceae bacterium]